MKQLRPRERQVMSMKSKGLTEREIARLLGIRYSTVRSYARNARERTGRTSIELACAVAVTKAMQSG